MRDVITKKKRGTHDRIKRKVFLVVTDDKNMSEVDVYRDFQLNPEEAAVRIIRSSLTGKSLDLAVKRYMQDHQIFIKRGDRVFRLLKNQKGGDAYD